MMINPQAPAALERARVSIIERLVPSFSFAIAALGGAAGAIYMQMVFRAMRESESAGIGTVYGAMAEVNLVLAVVSTLAAGVGVIGIIVAAARIFTTNRTSSPPGVLFLLPAGISLLSPFISGYAASLTLSAVTMPASGGLGGVIGTIEILNWAAIGIAVFALFGLALFTFIPFRALPGRRFTPVLFLLIIEGAVAALAIAFFLEYRMCLSQRDLY